MCDGGIGVTEIQRDRLESISRKGKDVRFKYKGRSDRYTMGQVEDEVYVMVNDYKHVLQRICFCKGVSWDGSTHAYRTGYYTYDSKVTRIVWGQYTQFLTEKEFKALLGLAREKGWDVF
jgi:hypothetical protein